MYVTESWIAKLFALLGQIKSGSCLPARRLAQIAGSIISMGPAPGPITRLRTRDLYNIINSVHNLNNTVEISVDVARELAFWKSCFDHFHGQPLRPLHPLTVVCTYSDASNFAWGGCTVRKGKEMVAPGGWPAEVRESSSTFRELRAAFLVLSSQVEKLKNSSVIHRTDNQAASIILATGSRRKPLQEEAIKVFSLCMRHGIRLYVEWIPSEENEKADYIFFKVRG